MAIEQVQRVYSITSVSKQYAKSDLISASRVNVSEGAHVILGRVICRRTILRWSGGLPFRHWSHDAKCGAEYPGQRGLPN